MHHTHNSLPHTIRAQSVDLLNRHLASAIDLHAQVKQAHWNVRGPGFIAVHKLFDDVAGMVEAYSDQIAERTGGLGGQANGTIQTAVEHSFLLHYPVVTGDMQEHVFAVSAALATFGDQLREAVTEATSYGDPATADLLTSVLRGIDQQLWLVESHEVPK